MKLTALNFAGLLSSGVVGSLILVAALFAGRATTLTYMVPPMLLFGLIYDVVQDKLGHILPGRWGNPVFRTNIYWAVAFPLTKISGDILSGRYPTYSSEIPGALTLYILFLGVIGYAFGLGYSMIYRTITLYSMKRQGMITEAEWKMSIRRPRRRGFERLRLEFQAARRKKEERKRKEREWKKRKSRQKVKRG